MDRHSGTYEVMEYEDLWENDDGSYDMGKSTMSSLGIDTVKDTSDEGILRYMLRIGCIDESVTENIIITRNEECIDIFKSTHIGRMLPIFGMKKIEQI